MISLTEREFIQLLLEKVALAGSQEVLAMELGIPVRHLGDVIQRKRQLGNAILFAMKFRKVIYYERFN